MISTWTKSKQSLENNFSNIILVYCLKWTKKLAQTTLFKYENDYIYTRFQKKLGSIAKWSGEKREREYKKFIEWTNRKFEFDEEDLNIIFMKIIILSVQIMINKELNDENCAKINFSPQLLNLREFFYICLKTISKYYFKYPERIYDTKDDSDMSNDIIKRQLVNYIPFKSIFDIVNDNNNKFDIVNVNCNNKTNENLDEKIDDKSLSHSSNNKSFTTKSESTQDHDDSNTNKDDDSEEFNNTNELSYIDSISLENKLQKYYNNHVDKTDNTSEDEVNIKHITLPKMTNNQKTKNISKYKYESSNTKNINNPDEKFFSD